MIRKIILEPNPLLHQPCRKLSRAEISSSKIQNLIKDLKDTSKSGEYGVGLSAVQVSEPVAVSLIAIKPTPNRPNLKSFNQVCINAEVVETFGEKTPLWEGCCSVLAPNGEPCYAPVPRFLKIKARFFDEIGKEHVEILEGFVAHVFQHETDHQNGVLYTNLIDPSTIISNAEYHELVKDGLVVNRDLGKD